MTSGDKKNIQKNEKNKNIDLILYTDITIISDKLSIGASILREKTGELYTTVKKSLLIFEALNSNEAELITGLYYLENNKITQNKPKKNINWFVDLPHILDVVKKYQKNSNKFKSEIDFILENDICRIPKTILDIKKHKLAHRTCCISRSVIFSLNLENSSKEEIHNSLSKRKEFTEWEVSIINDYDL